MRWRYIKLIIVLQAVQFYLVIFHFNNHVPCYFDARLSPVQQAMKICKTRITAQLLLQYYYIAWYIIFISV